MLADAFGGNNEPRPAALRERLADVRPMLLLCAIGAGGALGASLAGLAGWLPLGSHVSIILLVSGSATPAQVVFAMRARTARQLEARLIAFVFVSITLAAVMLHATTDLPWVGPLVLALVLAGAGTMLNARPLAAVTGYASLVLTVVVVGNAVGVIPRHALFRGHGDIVHASPFQQEPELAFATVVLIAGFGLPAISLLTFATARQLRRARDRSRAAAAELAAAELMVRESREQLKTWNEQLNREVAHKTRELEEQNRSLAAINAVSFALSGPMDEDGATERAARLVARVMGVRATQIYVAATGSQPAEGLLVPMDPQDTVGGLREELVRGVAESGVPRHQPADPAPAATRGQPLVAAPATDGASAYAVAPLIAKGRAIGAVAVIGERPVGWEEHELHLLELVGRELGIALENARLYRAALDYAAQEALLSDVVRVLGESGETKRALVQALEIVARRIGARFAAVVAAPGAETAARRIDARMGAAVPAPGAGRRALVLGQYQREPPDGSEAKLIARTLVAAPALVADRTHPLVLGEGGESTISPQLAARGIRTLILVPVVGTRPESGEPPPEGGAVSRRGEAGNRHTIVATLVVAAGRESSWGRHHSDLLSRVAGVTARRLETDAMLELRARRIRELSGLAELAATVQSTVDTERLYSGFARAGHKLVPYRHLYVARLDGAGELVEVACFGARGRASYAPSFESHDGRHPWFGRTTPACWSARRVEVPRFVAADDRHGLVVPLRVKGQVLGIVVLATELPPAEEQGALVQQAAEQLALALDSAALYRQATDRASRIEVLGNLAAIVASVVDLREAFDAFAEEVRWLIPFDRAVMMLIDEEAGTVEPYATYPEELAADARTVRLTVPLAGSLAAAVVEAGGPVALSRRDPALAGLDWSALGDDVQEVAAVPVTHGGACTAVFALAHTGAQRYEAEEFSALDDLAGLLAVTIERLQLYEQAEHNARHDLLTGLPNLRFLNERLQELRAGLSEPGESAILMIDLDDLKTFNDTLGHEAGDRVLRLLAGELRDACRTQDFVARTGGDEFVIVMEHAGAESASAVADRIHTVLTDAHTRIARAPTRVRVSIGVAIAPGDGAEAHQLLQAADEAMYEAKFAGGRRTRLASEHDGGSTVHRLTRSDARVEEMLARAATGGASEPERAALSLAKRYAVTAATELGAPPEASLPLRLLVAALAAERIAEPRHSVDRLTAVMLLSGLREQWTRNDAGAAALAPLGALAVELAWLQAPPGVGGGLPLDEALSRLRADPPPGTTGEALGAIEQSAAAEALERRREGRAA